MVRCENLFQLVRRDDFQLSICAVRRFLVETPAPELRRVTEPVALHVVIGDFEDKFRPDRFP